MVEVAVVVEVAVEAVVAEEGQNVPMKTSTVNTGQTVVTAVAAVNIWSRTVGRAVTSVLVRTVQFDSIMTCCVNESDWLRGKNLWISV